MSEKYSVEIVDFIKRFFEEDDWKYEWNDERGFFVGGINLHCKLGAVKFFLNVKDDVVVNTTTMEANVSEEKRLEVAEYLTRANYGMTRGGFEMDFNDGEVRFRFAASLADLRADYEEATRLLMLLPCAMFERYGDGLLTVMFGFATPEEAVKKAEED